MPLLTHAFTRFAGVICLLGSSYSTNALASAWEAVVFSAQFPPTGTAVGSVTFYQTPDDLVGTTSEQLLRPVSNTQAASILQQLHAPLQAWYPQLYSREALAQLAKCPLLAAPVDVDNNPQTHEQVLSSSTVRCLSAPSSDRAQRGDTQPHFWLVQQTGSDYAVLADSDGELRLKRDPASRSYQTIQSHVSIKRLYPEHHLQCGGADLTWQYRAGHYQLQTVDYVAQDCEARYFPNTKGTAWERAYAQYQQQVKVLVDQWLYRE